MPTIKDVPGPYRLHFVSFDCYEPPHVHVQRDRATAKFWLDPLALASNHGLSPRDLSAARRVIMEHRPRILEHGVSTAAPLESDPRALAVEVTDDLISARLADGRTISVPLAWSWRLAEAGPGDRARYELLGGGAVIHWPAVDEDISVRGMLDGGPAPRPHRPAPAARGAPA